MKTHEALAPQVEPASRENADVIFTVDEFAEIMRCSGRTVRRHIANGDIRKVEGLGRLVRIHCSEIARLARLAIRCLRNDTEAK